MPRRGPRAALALALSVALPAAAQPVPAGSTSAALSELPAPPPPPPALSLSASPWASAQPSPGWPPPRPTARVRASGQPSGAVLEGTNDEDDDDAWRPLCKLPCEGTVDPGLTYRVAAPWRRTSPTFHVREGNTTVVDASLGSRPLRVLGWVLTPVGGGVAALGLMIADSGRGERDRCDPATGRTCDDPRTAGHIMTGIGLTVLATGIISLLVSGSSFSMRTEL